MKSLYKRIDLFSYSYPDGKVAFVAGDPWDEKHSRGAVWFPSFCGGGPAWVLSCEETADDEDHAARWVAEVPR